MAQARGMQLRQTFVEAPASGGATPAATRKLLAMIATSGNDGESPSSRFNDVLVYLHGFPDMAVHPTELSFASRMPAKLAEFWLQREGSAFLAFNFGGIPGSDSQLRFADKTISQELEDAVAVCKYVRRSLLQQDSNTDSSTGSVHVVGLSTGAIVASLLRAQQVADSVTAIAGLLDLAGGVCYDFSLRQLQQCVASGACWKEFYLPESCPLPQHAELSVDGEHASAELSDADLDSVPSKLYVRLNRQYVDECRDGSLDIRRAVTGASLPPLLVIHGDADQNVPFCNGEQLFEAASEPKRFLAIKRANHLLTNSKHLKKALHAIGDHVAAVESGD